VGEASDAIAAVEPIDAACASGFVKERIKILVPRRLGSHVRHRLLEALRSVGAIYDRSLPGRLHGAAYPLTPRRFAFGFMQMACVLRRLGHRWGARANHAVLTCITSHMLPQHAASCSEGPTRHHCSGPPPRPRVAVCALLKTRNRLSYKPLEIERTQ
jgi:hypothetical protein